MPMVKSCSKHVKLFTIQWLAESTRQLEDMVDTINYNSNQIAMCQDELDVLKASLIKIRKQMDRELSRYL